MKDLAVGIVAVVMLAQMLFAGAAYGNHCILYEPSTKTITVLCGSARLTDIYEQLVDNSILTRDSHGVWFLNANLTIANNAKFYINSTDVSWLKINSTTRSAAYNIDILGSVKIDSVKITSWNSTSNNYTTTNGKIPRSSITVLPKATGKVDITSSEIGYLGYDSPLREGLAYYGNSVGGILQNNTIHHLWFGPYFKGVQDIKIRENRVYANISNIHEHRGPNTTDATEKKVAGDSTPPLLAITNPTFNSTIPRKRVLVEGTSFDAGLGVQKVEVLVQTYPLNNTNFDYQLANPAQTGNWSIWSIPISLTSVGPHRILAMATDTAGNQNWAEVTINVPFVSATTRTLAEESPKYRLAFVQPSFTEGAYNVGGFYGFYPKHNLSPVGVNVTADLKNLTAVVPEVLADEKYYGPLTQQIKKIVTDSTVSIIRDEDVHNGYIFGPDGSNEYDVIFLLHDEYATSNSYDNLRTFVANGGTIVFLDGNVFYAQVSYNKNMHTVTLLKGHDWQFDGKAAVKSVHERYFNETKQWVGSNFLYGDISVPILFADNPFNYSRFEENYVNNPNATILFDYDAQIPEVVLNDNKQAIGAKIGTYELSYGKGKVMMMGIYGQSLTENKKFLEFFDHILLPRALGQPYIYGHAAGNRSTAYWWMNSGKVSKIDGDTQSNALMLTLERTEQKEDNFLLTIPHAILAGGDPKIYNFTILVDGKKVHYSRTLDNVETGFEIPLTADAVKVQISAVANIVIPEGATKPTNAEFFTPAIINVSEGTPVIWTNNDAEIHTVTSGSPDTGGSAGTIFNSGSFATGRTFEYAFKERGTFDYFCTLHPFMTGKVVVK